MTWSDSLSDSFMDTLSLFTQGLEHLQCMRRRPTISTAFNPKNARAAARCSGAHATDTKLQHFLVRSQAQESARCGVKFYCQLSSK